MNATAGLSSSWTAARADPQQQAVQLAALKQQDQAERAVVALIDSAVADTRLPPAPDGQGRNVDIRV